MLKKVEISRRWQFTMFLAVGLCCAVPALPQTTMTVEGDLHVEEDITADGNITTGGYLSGPGPFNLKLGSTTALSLGSGAFTPGTDNTYDLGSTSLRLKTLYAYDGDFADDLTVADDATVGGVLTTREIIVLHPTTGVHSPLQVKQLFNGDYWPYLQFFKQRGSSGTQDSDRLGIIEFYGQNTQGTPQFGARIRAWQNGNVGTGYVPTNLQIQVSDTTSMYTVAHFDHNALWMRPRNDPGQANDGVAKLFCVNGELYARDGNNSADATLLSPHRMELYQPAPDDPLPWTYWSKNDYIGLKVNADISGALRELEKLSGKKFLYYDEIERTDWRQGLEMGHQRQIEEAKREILEASPEVEIALEDAWEIAEVVQKGVRTEEYTEYELDLNELRVVPVTKTRQVEEDIRIGEFERRLKPGVRFDPASGKLYRQRTLDEIVLDNPPAPPQLPQWVMNRVQ